MRFIKGFAQILQPLSRYLAGEGVSRKSERVSLTEDALKAFKALKQACKTAPILAFADYTKHSCWRLMHPRVDWGAVLSQKQADGQYYPIAYDSRALMPHVKNYHSTKLKFSSIEVGSYGALQGVPALPVFSW